jgi:hypothetical protein
MIEYVLSTGPLSVCLNAGTLSSYTGGVLTHCGTTINHCAQIVGVNVPEQYWIIRNTWGTVWGEHGYYYIALVRLPVPFHLFNIRRWCLYLFLHTTTATYGYNKFLLPWYISRIDLLCIFRVYDYRTRAYVTLSTCPPTSTYPSLPRKQPIGIRQWAWAEGCQLLLRSTHGLLAADSLYSTCMYSEFPSIHSHTRTHVLKFAASMADRVSRLESAAVAICSFLLFYCLVSIFKILLLFVSQCRFIVACGLVRSFPPYTSDV